jgi:hypothetical protein
MAKKSGLMIYLDCVNQISSPEKSGVTHGLEVWSWLGLSPVSSRSFSLLSAVV